MLEREPFLAESMITIGQILRRFCNKMINNIGKDVVKYKVIDPFDDPLSPKSEILRYGTTMIKRKVWITFKNNMTITLQRPLLLSSFTAMTVVASTST
ncbi:hypothetical protein Golob_027622 [Gossypium lobatum]|uniref:Uncharacterized protein n=1 Tax=Gossypium lobatum TaxID=34289 RepID=A0A7J8NFH9_9ROSI|nr:hypothetical protein [Gossypium lobatum]